MKVNDQFSAILPIFSVLGRLCIPDWYLTRYLTEWGQVQVHTYQYLKTSIYDQVHTRPYLFRQILLGYRALAAARGASSVLK